MTSPCFPGAHRTEFFWEGERGTGAELASALRGWEHLRYEVTEDAGLGTDGGRWMHTPELGIYFAQTDTAGNVVIPEDRIRFAMESAGSDAFELLRELRLDARSGVGRRARALPPRERGQPGHLAAPGGVSRGEGHPRTIIGKRPVIARCRGIVATGATVRTHPWFELRAAAHARTRPVPLAWSSSRAAAYRDR